MKLNWAGDTVVCVGSGPSLIQQDCEHVMRWQGRNPHGRVIAVNTSWQKVPTADVLFFMDAPWYRHYKDQLDTFGGLLVTSSPDLPELRHPDPGVVPAGCNSGTAAARVAISWGAKRVILLGMDCTFKVLDDKESWHWHGDHPAGLENARAHYRWPSQFAELNDLGVEIINCSRDTALDCFPRLKLENVISD
jgi:hypothetical protein